MTVTALYEVSPAQRAMLAGGGNDVAFVTRVSVALRGALDHERFQAAWSALSQRHTILRTGFVMDEDGSWAQFVVDAVAVELTRLADEEALAATADSLATAPIALGRPPLMRLYLAPARAGGHRLLWVHHHAILDGWSLQLLLAELVEIYGALADSAVPRLGEPRGFDANVAWLAERDPDASAAYWDVSLGSCASAPRLRRAAPGPVSEMKAAVASFALGADAAKMLTGFARRMRVTAAAVLHGLWALVAGHLLDTPDIVFGSTRSGRPADLPDADRIAGPFIVTLPCRLAVPPEPLVDWFTAVADHLTAMERHGWLDPARIRAAAAAVPLAEPLFETTLVVQNYAGGGGRLSGGGISVDVGALTIEGGEGRSPLLLGIALGDGLDLRFSFDPARLDEQDVARAAELIMTLIGRLAEEGAVTAGALAGALDPALRGAWRGDHGGGATYAAPIGAAEALVASVWSELASRQIGRGADLFDAGAHSLFAIELAARVSRAAGRRLTVSAIYEGRTVAGIAQLLENAPDPDSAPAIAVAGEDDSSFSLTELQRAYWIGRDPTIELGGRASFALVEIALAPGVEVDAIASAWRMLRARHAMLRAVITDDGRQRILADGDTSGPQPAWRVVLATPDEESGAAAALRATLEAWVGDARKGPLAVLGVLSVGADHRLFFAYDPIVCDAGSVAILTRELSLLVRDYSRPLAPIGLGFSDYVRALESLRAGPAGDRDRAYWRERLDTLPAAPELPGAIADPTGAATERFTRRALQLTQERWTALREEAASISVTPTVLLLAVYGLVLAEWARPRRFCLNLTLFNRQPLHPDVAALVGDFTSLTLLETDLRGVDNVVDAARRIQRQLARDLDHRLVDGVEVLRWLSQRSGRFQTMPVAFTATLGQAFEKAPVEPIGEVVAGYGQTPQVSLDCQVSEHEGALLCWWDCLDSRFAPGLPDTMFAVFGAVLDRLAEGREALDAPIVPVSPVDAVRRARCGDAEADAAEVTLHGPFLIQAALTPERIALICEDRSMSYASLEGASRRLAATIRLVAPPRAPVAILAADPFSGAVASLAVLRSGSPFVRLAPDWPAARCEKVLAIAGAALMLVGEGMEESAAACAPALCRHPIPLDVDAVDVDERADADDCAALAYIMFTSGSTGAPKGVAIEHRAAANTIADVNRRLGLGADDRVLAVSASTFDLSIYDLFAPLAVGGAVVFPPAAARTDPEAWIAALDDHGVTIWNSTPALMQMLLDRIGILAVPPRGPRATLLSGDWIPVGLAERMRRSWPAIRVIGLGGATEAAIWSVWEEIGRPLQGWTSVPYGTPLAHQTLDVRDEMLRPRPAWAVGDLYIGGAGLARGYYARPDLTAAAFVADPLNGERLYRTGDLARFRADGRIEFLGREDGQVKIRGHRIELGEIEALLMRQPGVAGAAAIVRDHAIHGFVVPAHRGRCVGDVLLRALTEHLPPYAVPARIVAIDAIPLTAHGKIDAVALMRLGDDAAPRSDAASRERDPVAEALVRLAGAVLRRPAPAVDEDLFLAGLDSVSAMQLIAGFYADNGHRITLATIFEHRCARAIVATLGDQGDGQPSPSPLAGAARAGSPVPASTMQRRLWLLDQRVPGDPRYIIPGAIVIEGPLDTTALAGAIGDVMERHAPLRTALRLDEGRLTQNVLPVPPSPLAILAGASDAEPWQSFATRRFALDQEVPSRFRLVPDGESRWLLEFAIHHSAIDAWSIAVLARDLAASYAARRGAGERPSPLAITYADFASWEAAREADGALDSEVAWWADELADIPTQALAASGPGEPEPVIVPIALDDAVARRLEALADRHRASLYMVLVALFAQGLRRHRRNDGDLVIASSVNGRAAAELEGLIGCFVNIVPVRIRLEGAADLDALMPQARQAALGAMAHQSVPFERIVAAARRRGSALDPPFAAMLVLQNNPREPLAVEGLTLSLPDRDTGDSRYPLHLHLERSQHGLTGALRADRFGLSRALVEAIASDFVSLAALDETSAPAPEQSVAVHRARLASLVRRSSTGSEA